MAPDTEEQNLIDRREAVKRVTMMLGGVALVGSSTGLLAACAKDQPRDAAKAATTTSFSAGDIATLDEIADTILPDTPKSPGAKAAKTGAFMALMVNDTYTPEDQKVFADGLAALNEASKKANGGKAFAEATPEQRTALLTALDKEQFEFQKTRKPDQPQHYFRMMKELAMLGFFTSEIGCTKALRYKESPGPFQPCVPYKAGDPAWAQHA